MAQVYNVTTNILGWVYVWLWGYTFLLSVMGG